MRLLAPSQLSEGIHSWSCCSHCEPHPWGPVTSIMDDHSAKQAAVVCCPRPPEELPGRGGESPRPLSHQLPQPWRRRLGGVQREGSSSGQTNLGGYPLD